MHRMNVVNATLQTNPNSTRAGWFFSWPSEPAVNLVDLRLIPIGTHPKQKFNDVQCNENRKSTISVDDSPFHTFPFNSVAFNIPTTRGGTE